MSPGVCVPVPPMCNNTCFVLSCLSEAFGLHSSSALLRYSTRSAVLNAQLLTSLSFLQGLLRVALTLVLMWRLIDKTMLPVQRKADDFLLGAKIGAWTSEGAGN